MTNRGAGRGVLRCGSAKVRARPSRTAQCRSSAGQSCAAASLARKQGSELITRTGFTAIKYLRDYFSVYRRYNGSTRNMRPSGIDIEDTNVHVFLISKLNQKLSARHNS